MTLKYESVGPFMRTVSGKKVYILNPRPEDYANIEDIAHHLSLIYRYNGGTIVPWSVAQHSLMMSVLVPPEYAFEALLHDAHEMVVGDNIAPMKRACPEIKRIDRQNEIAMRLQWGLPVDPSDAVKKADARMYATETQQLRPNADYSDAGYEPYPSVSLREDDWRSTKERFIRRFYELTTR